MTFGFLNETMYFHLTRLNKLIFHDHEIIYKIY